MILITLKNVLLFTLHNIPGGIKNESILFHQQILIQNNC